MKHLYNLTLLIIALTSKLAFPAAQSYQNRPFIYGNTMLQLLGYKPLNQFSDNDLENLVNCVKTLRRRRPPSTKKIATAKKYRIQINTKREPSLKEHALCQNSIQEIQRNLTNITIQDGINFYMQGNFDQAEHYWKFASSENSPEAMCSLGKLYEQQGKSELAERYFKHAADKYHFAPAIFSLASFYKQRQQFDLAEHYYKKSADEQNNTIAMNNLGHLYEQQQKFTLAIAYYTKAQSNKEKFSILNLLYLHSQGHAIDQRTLQAVLSAKINETTKEYYTSTYPNRWQAIKDIRAKHEIETEPTIACSSSNSNK